MPQTRKPKRGCEANSDDAAAAMAEALALLARRSLSRTEVADKLARQFSQVVVDGAVGRLEELGLVDDAALAESLARKHFETGRAGLHRIRNELSRRGLAADVVDDVVGRIVAVSGERESAQAELERFLRSSRARKETPQNRPAAAFRHLVRRGFSAELVRDLLGVSL